MCSKVRPFSVGGGGSCTRLQFCTCTWSTVMTVVIASCLCLWSNLVPRLSPHVSWVGSGHVTEYIAEQTCINYHISLFKGRPIYRSGNFLPDFLTSMTAI